jgi:hypothetical protein
MEKFETNLRICSLSTRYSYNLHVQNTNLSKLQKGVYSTLIMLLSNLPPTIKILNHDINMFKPVVK